MDTDYIWISLIQYFLENSFNYNGSNLNSAEIGGSEKTLINISTELAKDKEIIITMLTDDKAVNDIIRSKIFLNNVCKKTTVIDMSSTKPSTALDNYKKLKKRGVYFLDAPVSGGTKGAESASLAIMVGGEKKIYKKKSDYK